MTLKELDAEYARLSKAVRECQDRDEQLTLMLELQKVAHARIAHLSISPMVIK